MTPVKGLPATCDVPLPESLTINAFERVLSDRLRDYGVSPSDLKLDLSECRFIELVVLVHIIALVTERKRLKLKTTLVLPKLKDVRDFMRVWDFPTAIRDATSTSFSKLVVTKDLSYFGENSKMAELRYAKFHNYDGGLQRLLSSRFFAITSFFPAIPSYPRYALNQGNKWRRSLVKSVLSKYLSGPENYVGSRIVFEAATNAVRHPGARIIQTASTFLVPRRSLVIRGVIASIKRDDRSFIVQTAGKPLSISCDKRSAFFRELPPPRFRIKRKRISIADLKTGQEVIANLRPKRERERNRIASEITVVRPSENPKAASPDHSKEEGNLTIVFWDDGQSIVDTLKGAIKSGKKIRSIDVPELYADFEVLICDNRGEIKNRKAINSGYLPDATTPDDLLLLAATFPGITRDVTGMDRERSMDSATNPVLEAPGMGLFVLLNTAIDVFGGSVFFRTKDLGMSVKKSSTSKTQQAPLRYTAKIRHFEGHLPTLLGNIIVVRLPIREQRP